MPMRSNSETTVHTEAQSSQREYRARQSFASFSASVLCVSLCALWFLSAFFTSSCLAQQSSVLPLEGWYRTGRYMPVRVHRGQSAITAVGALPTEIGADGGAMTIVPLLVFANDVSDLRIDGSPLAGDPPLRALSSHQQLVAVAGVGDRLATRLFPGESIVTIHVDPLDSLPGPELAWQTIDALILDGPWPGSFDIRKLPALLAGGTQIAVRSEQRPDDRLPWESIDGGWVVRPAIEGPMGCDGNDDAYIPVGAWHPDLTGTERIRIVLVGVLFSLGTLACLLLPRRFSYPATIVLTLVAMIAIGSWQSSSPTIFRARGEVIVERRPLLQTDRWQFITARQTASAVCDCAGETWPIFADSSQPLRINVRLHWQGDGGRFTFELPSDGKLAFISRMIQPTSVSAAAGATVQTETPMTALARALYMRERERETVEPGPTWNTNDASPLWPTVHLWPPQ